MEVEEGRALLLCAEIEGIRGEEDTSTGMSSYVPKSRELGVEVARPSSYVLKLEVEGFSSYASKSRGMRTSP